MVRTPPPPLHDQRQSTHSGPLYLANIGRVTLPSKTNICRNCIISTNTNLCAKNKAIYQIILLRNLWTINTFLYMLRHRMTSKCTIAARIIYNRDLSYSPDAIRHYFAAIPVQSLDNYVISLSCDIIQGTWLTFGLLDGSIDM